MPRPHLASFLTDVITDKRTHSKNENCAGHLWVPVHFLLTFPRPVSAGCCRVSRAVTGSGLPPCLAKAFHVPASSPAQRMLSTETSSVPEHQPVSSSLMGRPLPSTLPTLPPQHQTKVDTKSLISPESWKSLRRNINKSRGRQEVVLGILLKTRLLNTHKCLKTFLCVHALST